MQVVLQRAAVLTDDELQSLGRCLGAVGVSRKSATCAAFLCDAPGFDRAAALAVAHEAQCDSALLPKPMSFADFDLIAFDMDSTLIDIECIDELAGCVGKKAEVAALTEQAMQSGSVDYDTSLRMRTKLLRGLPIWALPEVYESRVRFNPGVRELIATAQSHGLKVALFSGGFDYFAHRVAQTLGVDFVRCNTLAVADGLLTGELQGELVNAEMKAQALREVCASLGIDAARAITVGDGANDLKMMAIAGLSVGFCPKPIVRAHVDVAIDRLGLDSLVDVLT